MWVRGMTDLPTLSRMAEAARYLDQACNRTASRLLARDEGYALKQRFFPERQPTRMAHSNPRIRLHVSSGTAESCRTAAIELQCAAYMMPHITRHLHRQKYDLIRPLFRFTRGPHENQIVCGGEYCKLLRTKIRPG